MWAPPFGDGRFASEARITRDGDQGQKRASQSTQRESKETTPTAGTLIIS